MKLGMESLQLLSSYRHCPEPPLCLLGSIRTKQSLGTGWAPFAQARGLKGPSSCLILLFRGHGPPATAKLPEPGLGSADF